MQSITFNAKDAPLSDPFLKAILEQNKQGSTWIPATPEQQRAITKDLGKYRALDSAWIRRDGQAIILYTHRKSGGGYRCEILAGPFAAFAKNKIGL